MAFDLRFSRQHLSYLDNTQEDKGTRDDPI